ncbi:hypothetical protein [Fangia hongkongensis]|uniref:hypothetical protein n=1 Tax=Fangia hongkongensis TaxID=270495 RepID=UPI00036BC8A4|nr:hypothetical protein [Fangia hongkongensis]
MKQIIIGGYVAFSIFQLGMSATLQIQNNTNETLTFTKDYGTQCVNDRNPPQSPLYSGEMTSISAKRDDGKACKTESHKYKFDVINSKNKTIGYFQLHSSTTQQGNLHSSCQSLDSKNYSFSKENGTCTISDIQ